MEGICKGCGQLQTVVATNQEEADRKATMLCNCGEGEKIRNREELMTNIDAMCRVRAKEYGLTPIESETVERIKEAAGLVFEGKFDKATFSIEGSIVTIKRNAGKISCNRKAVLVVEGVTAV